MLITESERDRGRQTSSNCPSLCSLSHRGKTAPCHFVYLPFCQLML